MSRSECIATTNCLLIGKNTERKIQKNELIVQINYMKSPTGENWVSTVSKLIRTGGEHFVHLSPCYRLNGSSASTLLKTWLDRTKSGRKARSVRAPTRTSPGPVVETAMDTAVELYCSCGGIVEVVATVASQVLATTQGRAGRLGCVVGVGRSRTVMIGMPCTRYDYVCVAVSQRQHGVLWQLLRVQAPFCPKSSRRACTRSPNQEIPPRSHSQYFR